LVAVKGCNGVVMEDIFNAAGDKIDIDCIIEKDSMFNLIMLRIR
jgi:hypothetical protein